MPLANAADQDSQATQSINLEERANIKEEQPSDSVAAAQAKSALTAKSEVISSLHSALNLIEKNKKALDKNTKMLAQAEGTAAREQLEQEQKALQESLAKNRQNFVELATGGLIDLNATQGYEQEEVDWKSELADVVRPLMAEIKSITATQREQENLRVELAFYNEQLRSLKAASLKAQALLKQAADSNGEVAEQLKQLSADIANRISETESQIDVLNLKYHELQNKTEKNDWTSTLRDIVSGVLFHLLAALIGAMLIYYCFSIIIVLLDRIETETNPRTLFWVRAIQFFLRVLGLIVAVGVYCAILVAFSEWALMSISVIVLFGLMLSLKDVLPQYLVEMRTILNLGSIREGERIVYNGLPWRVNHLDFYTEIYNRDLSAALRLPISEVADLRSRPPNKSELWFPTRQGDYVILSDGKYGQVVRQSPDSVLLEHYGSLVSYPTLDFLAEKPQNLSRQRFTVFGVVGVGYNHQEDVAATMLEQINAYVQQEVTKLEYADAVTDLRVAFDLADASSLNYRIIMTCKGSAAQHYSDIRRWQQKVFVQCCNKYGWEIPFQQVTIHQAVAHGANESVAES